MAPDDGRGSPQEFDGRADADSVTAFLDGRLDALVDRSIEIAKRNGYAPFTTTIRAAWVEAILSVTEGLGKYLKSTDGTPPGPKATLDYKSDPRFARMRLIARQHRSLGITLPMYVGLFKHFRNLYVAELENMPDRMAPGLAAMVRDFFDETELSIAADWHSSDDNVRLRELQERARAITLDKDRYFAIFESLRNPAFLLDKTRNLVNANQAASELFLGETQAGDIIYLRSMRQRKSSLKEVIDQITEAVDEPDQSVWLDTLNGRRCYDLRIRALHDAAEHTAIGHVVLLNDVTEHRRAAERAQQSERGMSRFLATMSHEIRTPLHSVLGATDLLRTADVGSADEFLDVIEAAGQTLLQTLNNVLDYSKLENEPPAPRPVATHLEQAVRAFIRMASVGRNGGSQLSFEIAHDLPQHLRIDWAMTQQVLSNLVSNAIRVDDGRGVEVGLFETKGTAGGRNLRIEVRDHGPGIPADDAEALFQPFEKASVRETGSGGAGLGLAISHHLVEAMGGRIGYRNRDSGALLWFEVPFDPCEAAAVESPQAPGQSVTAPQSAPRCLLIDDDPIGSTVTRHLLERLGCRVDQAASVAQAIRAARRQDYDIYVVDYILPDGTGPLIVREIREYASNPSRFVALTANVEVLKSNEDMGGLFDGILAKPADQDSLASALLLQTAAPGAGFPARDRELPNNLDGLSPDTVVAMTEAFEIAWRKFREAISNGRGAAELGFEAHKLAGSSGLLGLHELEGQLRQFCGACREQDASDTVIKLSKSLDVELSDFPSWNRLYDREDQS